MTEHNEDLVLEKVNIQMSDIKKVDDHQEDEQPEQIQLRVYERRWLILAVVALLNNTNTMSWIAFAPVSNYVNSYYGESSAIVDNFDVIVLQPSLSASTGVLNGVYDVYYSRWFFCYVGRAEVWFEECYPHSWLIFVFHIFFMSSFSICSYYRLDKRNWRVNPSNEFISSYELPFPSWHYWSSYCGNSISLHYVPPYQGLKACMSSRQYLILLLVMGGGIGMFNCLYTIMQELLCPSGYSNSFVGICAALMIIGGVVGAAGSGLFVDRTKMYEETMKVAMGLAVVFGLIFMQLTLHPGMAPFLAITCVLFGILGLATYPVGLELSAECTFPVSEATSTGLIVLSGQVDIKHLKNNKFVIHIQSVIYVLLLKQFSRPLQPDRMYIQVCSLNNEDKMNQPKDNTMSVMENRARNDKENETKSSEKITLSVTKVTDPLNA
uniref:MFS domain-containing protein n=1 Tax=Heterorhabditis bacteriophora TaxID=37862 RepID=A0A1I7WSR5_HETBA